MSERSEHPAASHFSFPYFFDGTVVGGGGEGTTAVAPVLTFSLPFTFSEGGVEVTPTFPYSFPILFESLETSTTLDIFPIGFPIYFYISPDWEMEPYRGICFSDLIIILPTAPYGPYRYDLAIYYGDLINTYVEGRASRWDVQDYNIIVGTWLKKDDLNNLKTHIRPGAIRELKRVVYAPKFYDSTYHGYNTVRFYPTPSSSNMPGSTLHKMRHDTIAYVQNITEHPIPNSEFIELKLECKISSNQNL